MTEIVRRIFIDSRLRSINSRSSSDFSVDLPQEVACPSGTQLRIDNLVLSHSWPTVDDRNDNLYIKEVVENGTTYHRIVRLRHGIFNKGTLVGQLQDQLRVGTHISDGDWVVGLTDNNINLSNTSPTASATVYSHADVTSRNLIPVYISYLAGYVDTSDFKVIWNSADVVEPLPDRLADCCELVGLMRTRLRVIPGELAVCGHLDLQRHKSLYLCSNTLPSTSMDLHGRGDIIKQIVIGNAAPGQVVVDSLPSMASFSHFNTFTVLNNVNFNIRSHDGQIANMYDHGISFTIELLRPSDQ